MHAEHESPLTSKEQESPLMAKEQESPQTRDKRKGSQEKDEAEGISLMKKKQVVLWSRGTQDTSHCQMKVEQDPPGALTEEEQETSQMRAETSPVRSVDGKIQLISDLLFVSLVVRIICGLICMSLINKTPHYIKLIFNLETLQLLHLAIH